MKNNFVMYEFCMTLEDAQAHASQQKRKSKSQKDRISCERYREERRERLEFKLR